MYKRAEVKWREEGDGIFIFCPVRSEMFKLNATGRIVWAEIEKTLPDQIAKIISTEYNIDHETALKDVGICISDLVEKRLVMEV